MIKIYGSPQSSAGRCFLTLEEVGVKYQRQSLDFRKKEHKSPEYLKLNPNGKVPTIVDGELVLWESMAINYYLCEKYKPELLGKGPEVKAGLMQWSYWGLAELQPPLVDMLIEKFFVPPDRKNPAVNDKCIDKLMPLFAVLNTHLESREYLVDNMFSLAELNVVPTVDIATAVGIDLGDYPHVQAWLTRCHGRDSYQRFLAAQKEGA
ncbi:MAG: glutathione S-transferase family protein [Bdellovibrionota bacterium]